MYFMMFLSFPVFLDTNSPVIASYLIHALSSSYHHMTYLCKINLNLAFYQISVLSDHVAPLLSLTLHEGDHYDS